MRVFNVHRGPDTGGWGHRLGEAIRRQAPDLTFRSMYAPNAFLYIDYPRDLAWDRQTAQRLYDEADVVHLHNGIATAKLFERMKRPKPSVLHWHGTAFRQNPKGHLQHQERRGAIGIVSTLDLLLIAPDQLEWLPSPYNLEWLHGLRGVHQSRP